MSAVAPSMSLMANAAPMPQASPRTAQASPRTAQASPPTGSADNGFSRCLDQARENDAAPADEAPPRPSANKPASNAKADRAAREPRATRAAGATETPPKETTKTGEAQTDDDAADAAHDDATAPDLAALLPGWAPPSTPSSAAASAADDGALLEAHAAANGAKASRAQPKDDLAVRALALAGTVAKASDASPLTSSAALQAAASEQRTASPELQTSPLPTPVPSTQVAAATALLPSKAAETLPPTATVPAPIDSPAFAPALATQVRWWANDGVQQAQLLLNPAEMGPVTVNILLDGRDARIDFSADLAATRGAIEAALPVLAAALDDSGLKLSGGGVHDGSAQRQPEWRAHNVTQRTPATAAARDDTNAINAVSARGATARGMVDLVA